jgi:hypothetical protein
MVCGRSAAAHYYAAVQAADDDVAEALQHVRAREDAHEITTLEAANERVRLLERHLERLRQLRTGHLGDQP